MHAWISRTGPSAWTDSATMKAALLATGCITPVRLCRAQTLRFVEPQITNAIRFSYLKLLVNVRLWPLRVLSMLIFSLFCRRMCRLRCESSPMFFLFSSAFSLHAWLLRISSMPSFLPSGIFSFQWRVLWYVQFALVFSFCPSPWSVL
jgi:hypothetical protein